MKILDTPIRSISVLKKAPIAIIDEAKATDTGVGVVLSSDQYENLSLEKSTLEERLLNLEVENRLLTNHKLYSDVEVRGKYKPKANATTLEDDWA